MVLMGLYHGTETNLNFFVGTANQNLKYIGTERHSRTMAHSGTGAGRKRGGRQQYGAALCGVLKYVR